MSRRLQGIGASPGRVLGEVTVVRWDIPRVEHRTIDADEVDGELQRFEEALAWALERTEELRHRTEERLGDVEAKIFDPQALMLQDPDLVQGTRAYIRDNYLSAERAFDWRVLELRSRFADAAHAMVTDRLADLRDIRVRVLSKLLGREAMHRPEEDAPQEASTVLAFRELTPAFAVSLDPDHVAGILVATGSRASHAAVLSRSLHIPAVVGLGGGRQVESDVVDPAVGFSGLVALGARVASGDLLGVVHAVRPDEADRAEAALRAAIRVGPEAPHVPDLVRARVG